MISNFKVGHQFCFKSRHLALAHVIPNHKIKICRDDAGKDHQHRIIEQKNKNIRFGRLIL